MRKENRIFIRSGGQNTKYRRQNFESANTESISSCKLRHYIKKAWILLITGSLLLGILSGCSSNMETNNQGMSELQSEAYKMINDALNSDNPVIRVNAIEISATTRLENSFPTIQRLLQDPYVPVRFAAAVAIGEMQYSPALNAINQLLRDSDPNVLVAASYAMVRLNQPQFLRVLRDSVIDNRGQTIRANSALLLGKIGDRDSIQLLYQLMNSPDSGDIVAIQAAEALAMLGDEGIYKTLWSMLINKYADVRIRGVQAMGYLKTQEAENAILTMLSDPIPEIRLAAAEQLGKMNNKSGQNVVKDVIDQKLYLTQDMQSRERILTLTALAIGEIGTKDLTKFLPELMKNESPFVRLATAKAVIKSSRKL